VLDYSGAIINPSFAWYGRMHPQLLPTWLPIALTFTDQVWSADVQIGSNTPYWSLPFEVWYYILFGCAVFAPRRWAIFGCLVLAVLLGPGIVILLPVWLAGAATYRLMARISRTHEGIGWVLFLCSTIFLLALFYWFISGNDITAPQVYRLVTGNQITMSQANHIFAGQASWPRRYVVGALFVFHLVGFRLVQHRLASVLHLCAYPIQWTAGMTFSLYLYHFPLLTFLAAVLPGTPSDMTRRIVMICVPLIVIAGLAQVTERKKSAWRRVIDGAISTGVANINRRRSHIPVTLRDPR
jgi:peptidoglycan/LPS O-acetylase OafA/YrhL